MKPSTSKQEIASLANTVYSKTEANARTTIVSTKDSQPATDVNNISQQMQTEFASIAIPTVCHHYQSDAGNVQMDISLLLKDSVRCCLLIAQLPTSKLTTVFNASQDTKCKEHHASKSKFK